MSTDDSAANDNAPSDADAVERIASGQARVDMPQGKRPMSTGMKVLLGLIIVSCVLLIMCGGLFAYIGYKVNDSVVQDPELIAEMRDNAMEIDFPAGYEPVEGMLVKDFPLGFIPDTQLAVYRHPERLGAFIVGRMDLEANTSENIREQVENLADKNAGTNSQRNLEDVEELRTETVTIGEEEVTFRFLKGFDREADQDFYEVKSLWAEGDIFRMCILQFAPEDYDEEQALKIIRSIRSR